MKRLTLVLMLLVFSIVLLAGCGSVVITPPIDDNIAKFVGLWQNVDEGTNHIPRICITEKGDNLAIEVWGTCSPEDCYWGEELVKSSDAIDGELNVVWLFSFAEQTQKLLLTDNILKVTTYIHYINVVMDKERIDYFQK